MSTRAHVVWEFAYLTNSRSLGVCDPVRVPRFPEADDPSNGRLADAAGYTLPVICTPEELLENADEYND